MKMKKLFAIAIIGFASGMAGSYFFGKLYEKKGGAIQAETVENNDSPQPLFSNDISKPRVVDTSVDFVGASEISTSSVVFIRNISERQVRMSFLDMFFNEPGRVSQTVSTGSGVIFTSDGYIVTNNHVVEDATRVEVIHNKKNYDALVIGTDPSTDLAVLKVSATNLPKIPLGSSQNLNVGEWVLAVGNPFNLTSTVTAGIVSAKGRSINILKGKFPIESFIQTDAAINPGNSGGALVNKNGELVGINTAILSRTGSYAGYGFAVPIDIAKKVVRDIIEFGEVQKAFFGGDVTDLTEDVAERLDIDSNNGDYSGVALTYLQKDGAAAKSGLEEGDIILNIQGSPIDSKSDFDEMISYYSPGDEIDVLVKRKNKEIRARLTLTNREGTTSIIKTEIFTSKSLGADLEAVPKVERDLLEIEQGIRIKKVYRGGLIDELDLSEDFIVTSINSYPIKTPEDLADILGKVRGRVRIEGVDAKGTKGYYSYYFR